MLLASPWDPGILDTCHEPGTGGKTQTGATSPGAVRDRDAGSSPCEATCQEPQREHGELGCSPGVSGRLDLGVGRWAPGTQGWRHLSW